MERLSVEEIKYLKQKMQSNMNVYFYDEVMKVFDELISYRDAEEQGLLLRLPCKEGTEVYVIDSMLECKHDYDCPLCSNTYKCEEDIPCEHQYIQRFIRKTRFSHTMINNIGKTVFLTKEEAEQALKQMGE